MIRPDQTHLAEEFRYIGTSFRNIRVVFRQILYSKQGWRILRVRIDLDLVVNTIYRNPQQVFVMVWIIHILGIGNDFLNSCDLLDSR